MSIKLMTAVWDVDMQSTHKLVLLAMADFADDDGRSLYPSIATVARKTCVGDRQVQRIIKQLCDGGFLSIVGNIEGGKPGMTREYAINRPAIGLPEPTGVKLSPVRRSSRVTPVSQTGDAHVTQPVREPLDKKEPKGSKKAGWVEHAQFGLFWQHFPKQRAGSKDKAIVAFNQAVERIGMAEPIIQGVIAYAASEEVARGYAKGAAAWLNDDRWTVNYRHGPGKPQATDKGIPVLQGRDAQVML